MADESNPVEEVAFHYLKSNQFRVIHADGAWGGLSPQGKIRLVFYNERQPIPQITVNKVSPEGELGEEIRAKTVTRVGFVREMEVDIVFNLKVAEGLRNWLDTRIQELQAAELKKKAGSDKSV